MRARSPIETMVDQACGLTPSDLAKPAPPARDIDHDAAVLAAVGNAAVAWLKLRDSKSPAKRAKAEQALVDATKALEAIGW
jgi:hypothetical protein